MTKKKILFVGGGSGGHLFPLIPLIKEFEQDTEAHLLTSDSKLDNLIVQENFSDLKVKHHIICTGKIRAYLSLQNFKDIIKIRAAITMSLQILKEINPDYLFFKGGYVGFPLLMALKKWKSKNVKIFLHESDISMGKLTQKFSKKATFVFKSYGATATPLFWHVENTNLRNAKNKTQIKKKLLVFGGSQGALALNQLIVDAQDQLSHKYETILVTGSTTFQSIKPQIHETNNILVHEFLPQAELYQKMEEADLVLTRAGASIFQLFHLQKKALLVPLPGSAREHQRDNAQYFTDLGVCHSIEQRKLTTESLLESLEKLEMSKTIIPTLKTLKIESNEKEIAERIRKS